VKRDSSAGTTQLRRLDSRDYAPSELRTHHKNLTGPTRFVSVWNHVGEFVLRSTRAGERQWRSAVASEMLEHHLPLWEVEAGAVPERAESSL